MRLAAIALIAASLQAQTFVEYLRLPALEEINYAEWHPKIRQSCDFQSSRDWLRVEMAFDETGSLTLDAREIPEPEMNWVGCPLMSPPVVCGQPVPGGVVGAEAQGLTVSLCSTSGSQS